MRGNHPENATRRTRRVRATGLWVAAFTLLAGTAVLPAREAPAASSSNANIRSDTPLKQYRAYRRMHAATDKGKHEAWMEAWTELDNGRFSYQIVSERGSIVFDSGELIPAKDFHR